MVGLKVLVVDDSPDNQALIMQYLNKYGELMDSAETGSRAFSKAMAGNFDFVLMDIEMPEWAAIQQPRNCEVPATKSRSLL